MLIFLARLSLFAGDSCLESLTPHPARSKSRSSSTTRPATNMEPTTGPLPASSAPRSNIKEHSKLRMYLRFNDGSLDLKRESQVIDPNKAHSARFQFLFRGNYMQINRISAVIVRNSIYIIAICIKKSNSYSFTNIGR